MRIHSTVALIMNSSTAIFSTDALKYAAANIEIALRQLLMVLGSDLSVEDVLDAIQLDAEFAKAGDTEFSSFEDNEIPALLDNMDYGSWRRDG